MFRINKVCEEILNILISKHKIQKFANTTCKKLTIKLFRHKVMR